MSVCAYVSVFVSVCQCVIECVNVRMFVYVSVCACVSLYELVNGRVSVFVSECVYVYASSTYM